MGHSFAFQHVRVFAPATVANVACGFDVLGFALSQPGDEVVMHAATTPGITIRSISGDDGRLPKDPLKNTAAVAAQALLNHLGLNLGVEIELLKQMPLGSGLGSSAASAAAGAVALNELLGRPLSTRELLPFAMEGERIACGSAHADNVGPSLLGNFVLIRSYDPLDTVVIESPSELVASVVHPHIEIRTEDARKILRKEISLKSAIVQWGNTAGLIAGLLKHDYALIGRSLKDVIIEPERSILIPGFAAVKAAAIGAGALGCSISGSGPSVFALSQGPDQAARIGHAMQEAFRTTGITSDCFVSAVNSSGVVVRELT